MLGISLISSQKGWVSLAKAGKRRLARPVTLATTSTSNPQFLMSIADDFAENVI